HGSPPLAEAWFRVMLDARGGPRVNAPTLEELQLRSVAPRRQAPRP
ncbi:hypothetical protein NL494_27555, partial [Klebsiella pneumoniae]|nr:hypothetical protein [Klebsiella pneumoniae]